MTRCEVLLKRRKLHIYLDGIKTDFSPGTIRVRVDLPLLVNHRVDCSPLQITVFANLRNNCVPPPVLPLSKLNIWGHP